VLRGMTREPTALDPHTRGSWSGPVTKLTLAVRVGVYANAESRRVKKFRSDNPAGR